MFCPVGVLGICCALAFCLHLNNRCANMNALYPRRKFHTDTVPHITLGDVLRLNLQGSKRTGLMMTLRTFRL